ncbi:MAG TPA: tetratricopeptide repeat protein [Acidobacteriota bacterium]|nr:tetratricopeptide repeat protein [Acidobacteriota bacterium]HQQ46314.1 tetratricopeptide repeat protein [Acidobacteriota bacterium]
MTKGRAVRALGLAAVFALLACAFSLHVRMRELTAGYPDEYRSYYIPSSTQAKAFSLGYHNAAADILFIWFLQFYDWYNRSVRYGYMEHTFDVMTDLDPKFQEAYMTAALFAFIPLKYDYVYKFLDKGIEKNPDNFVLPYDAGCYAFFSEKNFERAAKYFKIAQDRNPDKALVRNLYAKALLQKGDLESALDYFRELFRIYENDTTPEGNYYRAAAVRHIWSTVNAIGERDIGKAVEDYRSKHGKNPPSLSALKKEGLLSVIPRDPAGNEFGYDPASGRITCLTPFDPKKAIGRW